MIRAVPDRLRRSSCPQTESLRIFRAAMMAAVVCALGAIAALAQTPLHDPQYTDADIAYGATLYTSRCVTCHGPGIKQGKFDMPNPGLPKLNIKNGMKDEEKKHLAMMKFMVW